MDDKTLSQTHYPSQPPQGASEMELLAAAYVYTLRAQRRCNELLATLAANRKACEESRGVR